MPTGRRSIRRTVTLPAAVARRVQTIAKRQRSSASRVIVDLIGRGLDAREREKAEFFQIAERLAMTPDPTEQVRLKELLARRTFGEPL